MSQLILTMAIVLYLFIKVYGTSRRLNMAS